MKLFLEPFGPDNSENTFVFLHYYVYINRVVYYYLYMESNSNNKGVKKMSKIITKLEVYPWGLLRKILVGHSYTLVLHEEEWEAVMKVLRDEIQLCTFSDETRRIWIVTRIDNDAVRFIARDTQYEFDVPMKKLRAIDSHS